jgi:cyclic pyranopterin phosphate synthase
MAGEEPQLTHVDAEGTARMVDVGDKEETRRTARARATVRMATRTAGLLAAGDLPKGDAIAVARIAGIQAAKRTHELIPLCHQLRLSHVDVDITVDVDRGEVAVEASVRADDRTGVEMEALVAASVASLTLYDMVKAVQRDVVVSEVRLVEKTGGRSGDVHQP